MKLAAIGGLCLLLIGVFSYAGIFAKHLPTYDSLKEKIQAELNAYKGSVDSETSKRQLSAENEAQLMAWNSCVMASPNTKEISKLGYELDILLEYYRITGGTEESAEYFDKWIKEIHGKWVEQLADITACYDKATRI